MKFPQMKKLGLVAFAFLAVSASSSAANSVQNSAECKVYPTTHTIQFDTYVQPDGMQLEGKCAKAVHAAEQEFNNTFDKQMVEASQYDNIYPAINDMGKEAATNPKAKELQDFYREVRANFINEFLSENNFTQLSTKAEKTPQPNNYQEKAGNFFDKATVLSRIQSLREPVGNKATQMLKYCK